MSDFSLKKQITKRDLKRGIPDVNIVNYPNLVTDVEKLGVKKAFLKLFRKTNNVVIGIVDPTDPHKGHWQALKLNPDKKEIYFFCTFGEAPDISKSTWMLNSEDREKSHQMRNVLEEGIKEYIKDGYKLFYNKKKYQKPGDNSLTCGLWDAAFLISGKKPKEFNDEVVGLRKQKINVEEHYYKKIFEKDK